MLKGQVVQEWRRGLSQLAAELAVVLAVSQLFTVLLRAVVHTVAYERGREENKGRGHCRVCKAPRLGGFFVVPSLLTLAEAAAATALLNLFRLGMYVCEDTAWRKMSISQVVEQ